MCLVCNPPQFDQAKSSRFAERMLQTLNGAGLALMLSVGHRTGLLDAMSAAGPEGHSVASLSLATSMSPRYVREWLGALTAGGILTVDDQGNYRLPAEHSAFLTRGATPNNLAGAMQWVGLLGGVEDKIVEAFRHGRGVPYSAYNRFDEVMAEESEQTVVAALEPHIVPLVEGLNTRLGAGIDVLDVGCGQGRALLALANRYRRSRFIGYDLSPGAVEHAQGEARRLGLINVAFKVQDAATFTATAAFDLITTFDAIHDQAKPGEVLVNIRRALRPGGVYLCQEIRSEGRPAEDAAHPLGAFIYAISTFHCMSVSLANGGPGLGAAWGRTLCTQMLSEAGFTDIDRRELPHDILNDFYICRV